jgi:hypothetical protein
LLDRAKTSKILFFLIFFVITVTCFTLTAVKRGSVESIERKYSITGFTACCGCFGFYLSIMVAIVIWFFKFLIRFCWSGFPLARE